MAYIIIQGDDLQAINNLLVNHSDEFGLDRADGERIYYGMENLCERLEEIIWYDLENDEEG